MGYVVRFFEWIFKIIEKACEWASSLGGKITLFVTTMFSTIAGAVSFVIGHFTDVAQMFDYATAATDNVAGYIQGHPTGYLLAHAFSVDVAVNYLVSVTGIFCGLVGTLIIALFSYAMVCFVFPLVISVVLRTISLLSGGFVKP